MALNRKVLVIAGLLIPFFAVLLMSHNTFADSATYSQATVDFYAGQQVNATVNLPWYVNPGTHRFFLNSVHINNYAYANQAKAYISGRIVIEFRPQETQDAYVCGLDASWLWGQNVSTHCLGSFTVVYTDNSRAVFEGFPVFMSDTVDAPYRENIYFDFAKQLDASKQISFIQFNFEGASGYDVWSRNTNWYDRTLLIVQEARSTIDTYASMDQISNELLQTQINQNQTIINQNNQYYNHEYEAEDNIKNQSTSDIPNSSDNQTTSLIGFLSGFITAITNGVGQGNDCAFRLRSNQLGDGTTINMMVNPCVGRDKFTAAGGDIFFDTFLPIIAIMFYLPFVIFILRLIYKEIRSFTN